MTVRTDVRLDVPAAKRKRERERERETTEARRTDGKTGSG
jgi:hypothetical protein